MERCPTGNNRVTIKKWAAEWKIDTSHFDPHAAANEGLKRSARQAKPLEDVLVEGSTYSRGNLKQRLYAEGMKMPICELCGQGEKWNGMEISMILDHINGVRDDNRIENLRIVCPNCAAGLDTHCGRGRRTIERSRDCLGCGEAFRPKYRDHRYCSRTCGQQTKPSARRPRLEQRKVERPPYKQLLDEVKRLGWSAVGRKYGVSDNSIRKWIRSYERERAIQEGRDPNVVEIPTRTWPNQRSDKKAA
jgi:HNH endonuclease